MGRIRRSRADCSEQSALLRLIRSICVLFWPDAQKIDLLFGANYNLIGLIQTEFTLVDPSIQFDPYAYCAYIQQMKFQYDPAKARSNRRKHGISFADAEGVFYDDLAIHLEDAFAEDEDRWLAVGMGSTNQILVVVYTVRDDEIRLISVRRATRREVQNYEERI